MRKTIHEKLDELGDGLGGVRTELAVLRTRLDIELATVPELRRTVAGLERWRRGLAGGAAVMAMVAPDVWGWLV